MKHRLNWIGRLWASVVTRISGRARGQGRRGGDAPYIPFSFMIELPDEGVVIFGDGARVSPTEDTPPAGGSPKVADDREAKEAGGSN